MSGMGGVAKRPYGRHMVTLHIEHAVSDLASWKQAFGRAAPIREQHGVRRHEVRSPTNDPQRLLIDLTFDDVDAAERFLVVLHQIWRTPAASPALVGAPQARILEQVDPTEG